MRVCSRVGGIGRGGGPAGVSSGSSGDLSAPEAGSSMGSGSLGDLFGDAGVGGGPVAAATDAGAGPSSVAGSPLHPTLWFRAFDNERLCDHM